MTEPTNIEDLDADESIVHYLSLCALIAEGRRHDAFDYLTSLEPMEAADMWLAGASVTLGFADNCRAHLGIPVDVATWFRAMTVVDAEDDR